MNTTARSAVVACCLLATAIALQRSGDAAVPGRERLDGLPGTIGPWRQQRDEPIDREMLAALGVDDVVNRVYAQPGGPLQVAIYVGYHGSQRQGDTIHSPLNCLPGAGWQPVSRGRTTIGVKTSLASNEVVRIRVSRVVIEKGLDRSVVLYWYQSQGRVAASEYWGKALLVFHALSTSRTDGALVRVMAPVRSGGPGQEAASEAAAVSFVHDVFPLLERFLPR